MTPQEFLPQPLATMVAVTSAGCWEWTGGRKDNGYGSFRFFGKSTYVHRFVLCLKQGALTPGMVTDHLCRNRACCNPAHLEEVTNRENTVRGAGPAIQAAIKAAITECPNGHPYDAENTKAYPDSRDGKITRHCRACARASTREWKAKRRAEKRSA